VRPAHHSKASRHAERSVDPVLSFVDLRVMPLPDGFDLTRLSMQNFTNQIKAAAEHRTTGRQVFPASHRSGAAISAVLPTKRDHEVALAQGAQGRSSERTGGTAKAPLQSVAATVNASPRGHHQRTPRVSTTTARPELDSSTAGKKQRRRGRGGANQTAQR
jgi:hypothetical protein